MLSGMELRYHSHNEDCYSFMPHMKKWNIYLINLARSNERLKACARQFEAFDLPFERIDAVDGDDLSNTDMDALYNFSQSAYHKHLTSGEIGCYLSHIRVWQKIVDEQLDYAVVLEDDVILQDNIQQGLAVIESIEQPWDIIKLAEVPIKRKVIRQYAVNNFSLVIYNKLPSGTCAQVVSLAGAKKLLALSGKIARPIDIELQYWWNINLSTFGLKPYIVEANEAEKSEINRRQARRKAKQSLFKKAVSGFYFLFKNKKELKKRLDKLN